MKIYQSIDIEEEVRTALSPYQTAYCRPLPDEYGLPNILITQVGGTTKDRVDTFEVVIDSRALIEADALGYLNRAEALLTKIAKEQTTAIRHVVINSSGSWGADPVRPDLAMCSARLSVTAHQQLVEVK